MNAAMTAKMAAKAGEEPEADLGANPEAQAAAKNAEKAGEDWRMPGNGRSLQRWQRGQ
jgi:hypothetical protein